MNGQNKELTELKVLADEIKEAKAKHNESPDNYSLGYWNGLEMALDIIEGRIN